MIDMDFKQIGPGLYRKWNPQTRIRTTVKFEGGNMHVRHEAHPEDTQAILDFNVMRQNDHKGFKDQEIYQASSIPSHIYWGQIMPKCGFKNGQGFDERKFKQILNDRDNYKLKCVPGKI